MTLRSPRASSSSAFVALGRMGRGLEAALAALSEQDRGDGATRAKLVQAASDALWCFLVQREFLRAARSPAGDPRLPCPRRGAKSHGHLSRPASLNRHDG